MLSKEVVLGTEQTPNKPTPTWVDDLSDSAYDFKRLVYPKLIECGFVRGRCRSTEEIKVPELVRDFDQLSGIDVFLIEDEVGITGIANRIQWECQITPDASKPPWDSFTVRTHRYGSKYKTELEKRVSSINNEQYFYPYWTCQAYITTRDRSKPTQKDRCNGILASVAIAPTKDVLKVILKGLAYKNNNHTDYNEFAIVFWEQMREESCPIYIWRAAKYPSIYLNKYKNNGVYRYKPTFHQSQLRVNI